MDTRVLALVAHRQVALARRHVVDDGAVTGAAALRCSRTLGRVTVARLRTVNDRCATSLRLFV